MSIKALSSNSPDCARLEGVQKFQKAHRIWMRVLADKSVRVITIREGEVTLT